MRRLGRILTQAMKAVLAYRMRGVFCLASVALGVAAITVIVAATEGAYDRALKIVDRFGPDSLLVLGGGEEARPFLDRRKTLTVADADAIRQRFPSAYLVVPMSRADNLVVSFQGKTYRTRVIGATARYGAAWSWPVVEGSDLTDSDLRRNRNVALIGSELQKELFGTAEPVGKYVLLRKIPVRIVGVLSQRGAAGAGHNLDNRLVMPLSTVMKKILNERKYVDAIRIRFTDRAHLHRELRKLKSFLRRRHGLPPGVPNDFQVISPSEIVHFLVALTGSLVIFIGVAGVTSLVVAGFVLANLFLLSVKERTREIGIRRSVGARRRDIRAQFLGEVLLVTAAGGLAGFLLGVAASRLLTMLGRFPILFSWKAFAVAMLLSGIVGIASGLQPAARAANLEPMEAIRT